MLRNSVLVFCILCAAILIGCSKTETSNENTTATNSSKAPSTAAAPPTTAKTESAGEKIGVPECDEFIAKYDACVSSKVPEAARAQYQSAVRQWRDSWKKLAENPNTKPTLVSACKQAAEQQAAALKAYGCSF
jgi:hypothetical protein